MTQDIYELVKTEEKSYQSRGVAVAEGYEWSMYNHIIDCILYKDGRLKTGNTDDKPVKNIILPLLNVAYRTEGFDVKDIEPYVNSAENYHKSFLVRKFHEKWARMNSIDTFIDDLVESYVDFGGALVKNVKGVRPEVIPLQKLAFCDQTDILSGPFAIKHQFSIDQVKARSGIWDKEAIDQLVISAREAKPAEQSQGQESKTPGKYIEVYEVHGMFPITWLSEDENQEELTEDDYSRQVHIISLLPAKDRQSRGVTLFRGKEKDGLFKVLRRDKRYGTALGRSAIEELIESQVWTNYGMIQQKFILDKAALMLGVTDDPSFATKNKITDLEQGEWLTKQANTTVEPFIFPTQNLQQFEQSVVAWEAHARATSSANEATLGVSPTAGTPFKLQELVVSENRGMHIYRQGQISTFVSEIYRDWVLPHLVDEMNDGQKFLAELSLDELEEIAQMFATNQVNKQVKRTFLSGRIPSREQMELLKQTKTQDFKKGGTKRFLSILEEELKDIPVDVRMNIAGKQKDLQALADRLSNVFRQLFPQGLYRPDGSVDPNAAKVLNSTYEASGLSPINFKPVLPTPTEPLQEKPTKV